VVLVEEEENAGGGGFVAGTVGENPLTTDVRR
jgi:hypothetical protein